MIFLFIHCRLSFSVCFHFQDCPHSKRLNFIYILIMQLLFVAEWALLCGLLFSKIFISLPFNLFLSLFLFSIQTSVHFIEQP